AWLDFAQALVLDDLPAAAARALRLRMALEPPLEDAAVVLLARALVVVDAEAAHQDQERDHDAAVTRANMTVELLGDLDRRGLLQRVFDTPQPIDLAQGLHEAS